MPLKWGKMDELCIKYDSQVKSVIKYYILNFIGSQGNAEGMPARRDEYSNSYLSHVKVQLNAN